MVGAACIDERKIISTPHLLNSRPVKIHISGGMLSCCNCKRWCFTSSWSSMIPIWDISDSARSFLCRMIPSSDMLPNDSSILRVVFPQKKKNSTRKNSNQPDKIRLAPLKSLAMTCSLSSSVLSSFRNMSPNFKYRNFFDWNVHIVRPLVRAAICSWSSSVPFSVRK